MDYKDIIKNIGKYHYILVVGKKVGILGSNNKLNIAKNDAIKYIDKKNDKLATSSLENQFVVMLKLTLVSNKLLKENKEVLPDSVMPFLPYLIKDNWLLNYTNFEGIEKTLIGMNKRTHKQSQMHLAIADLKLHYTDFESDFTDFFENLRTFSANKILEIP